MTHHHLFSRREFVSLGAAAIAGGTFTLLSGPSPLDVLLLGKGSAGAVGAKSQDNSTSNVYSVEGFPHLVSGHHVGLERLLALMGANGLRIFKCDNGGLICGPDGLIAADDLVLIKVNCQWGERGGTNTDLVRGLVRKIIEHPDGFRGEIVVVDNGQGRGLLPPSIGSR
jgi:hypothetical protein